MNEEKFVKPDDSFFVDAEFEEAFGKMGLNSVDGVFKFDLGKDLHKKNLASHRQRIEFATDRPAVTLYLKRYDQTPWLIQIKNWINHKFTKSSMGFFDVFPAKELAKAGINTPRTIAYGSQWGRVFEKRSFSITQQIANAESLEKKLPESFYEPASVQSSEKRKDFIVKLAEFIRKFHRTGYRHRDLYLCHIFCDSAGKFYLIDLARAFKPLFFSQRYRVKDIAQLYYSAPGRYFSRTDRLRFYYAMTGKKTLCLSDKIFIRKVKKKINIIARHDRKHGRSVPFEN